MSSGSWTTNSSLYIGHRYTAGINAGAFGAEHSFHVNGINFALYGEGRVGENNYKAGWAGIQLSFSAQATRA